MQACAPLRYTRYPTRVGARDVVVSGRRTHPRDRCQAHARRAAPRYRSNVFWGDECRLFPKGDILIRGTHGRPGASNTREPSQDRICGSYCCSAIHPSVCIGTTSEAIVIAAQLYVNLRLPGVMLSPSS